ncbi:alpha/beta fold hydrolase [Roseateles noduli]|uniref:alpha/beta fold hydrolase n=1 Tax=Roseateles noduli TaxID=2052484 RepID=UPI003D65BE47
MNLKTTLTAISFALVAFAASAADVPHKGNPRGSSAQLAVSDAELLKTLPGFRSEFATVNGARIHYVVGGEGPAVLMLPGWPVTWWSYHKIMPELAKSHRVIVADLRGMGQSEKTSGGFDKKNMAKDMSELVTKLGLSQVDVIGHDIGAMVAFSFAANHPDQTRKLVMLDVAHPSAGYMKISMLPDPGTFNDKIDENHPYLWWFAFHQVKGLPEELLEGRAHLEHEWFFRYMLKNEAAIDKRDRAVYAAAYGSKDAIRASNGWYQAFEQDIADDANYGPLKMPVLGLGGPGYPRLKATLNERAPGSQTFRVEGSGHFVAEEKPEIVLKYLKDFLN